MDLISEIVNSNDCVHRQGSYLRCLFARWWFKYLSFYGYDTKTIATKFIPMTYGEEINKKV